MSEARPAGGAGPRVVVLADDLIWATRLVDGVGRAGGRALPARTREAFEGALAEADGALVDLTARAYDGLAAIGRAHEAGVAVVAVGQHDDTEQRRAAKAAGASRVHAYRALFEHGDRELTAWLATLAPAEEERS
ncbi:MAG TPA: hypothetical protein VFY23_05605 [Candidatus Limnocylindrales bacterium]|nr:hypothetical protein [Candidatus Limnocylindrales bacterium]